MYTVTTGTPEVLAQALAIMVAEQLVTAQQAYDMVTLVLAGGTSFTEAYKLLFADPRIIWERVQGVLGDERLSLDPSQQNYRAIRSIWDQVYPGEPAIWLWNPDLAQSYEVVCAEYAAYVARCTEDHAIDVLLLGVGPDGHTASLFADQFNELESSDEMAVLEEYPATEPRVPRVTLTPFMLRQAEQVHVLVQGSEKAAVLRSWDAQGIAAPEPIWRLVAPIQAKTHLYTDGSLLT